MKTLRIFFAACCALSATVSSSLPSWGIDLDAVVTVDNAYGFGFGDFNGMNSYFGGLRNTKAQGIFNGAAMLYTAGDANLGNGYTNFLNTTTEIGPELYQLTNVNTSDYLYIVGWSDNRTTQGALASFEFGNTQVGTGSGFGWEVYATGINRASGTSGDTLTNTPADLALINTEIGKGNTNAGLAGSSTGWVDETGTLTIGGGNGVGQLVFGEDNSNSGGAFQIVNALPSDAQWMWYSANTSNTQPFSTQNPNNNNEFLIFRTRVDALLPCVEEASLAELLDGSAIIGSGDKKFSEFTYNPIGDMPSAEDVFVKAITDADGHFGIRFQGAFVDSPEGGASDALIEFKVTAPEGKLIKDVHMQANPLVIGGAGLVSITETFLPGNDQTVLSVYDIPGGERKLTDWADLVDENGELAPVQELDVQKDIIIWAQEEGAYGTLSFFDQTFSQCDDLDGDGVCDMGVDPVLCGDFDGDGDVDAADLAILLASYGNTVPPGTSGDADNDGDVDGDDLLALQQKFTDAPEPIPATTVPEPTAFLLLASAIVVTSTRRRM